MLKPQCECIYTYMEDTYHYTYSKDEMGKSGKPQCCAAIGDLKMIVLQSMEILCSHKKIMLQNNSSSYV